MSNIPTINMEAKKDGLQQTQDGLWKVSLRVHPDDMRQEFVMASMGQRFQLVMVAVDDDETPKDLGKTEKPKRRFSEMSRAQQAGMLCADERFTVWLASAFPDRWDGTGVRLHWQSTPEVAAEVIRVLCHVKSRANIDDDQAAAATWDRLVAHYRLDTGQEPELRS